MGELVLLADQDRTLWDRALIAEGISLVERAISSRRFGPYTLQAAIAAVHAEAATADDTDWAQIVGLYDVLARADRVSRYRAEPRGRDRDARRPGGGPCDRRRHHGARRSRRLSPGALGTRGFVPASGTSGRRTRGVSARAGACASGAGKKVSGEEIDGA